MCLSKYLLNLSERLDFKLQALTSGGDGQRLPVTLDEELARGLAPQETLDDADVQRLEDRVANLFEVSLVREATLRRFHESMFDLEDKKFYHMEFVMRQFLKHLP